MKIGILGCKGIPNNHGGYEQFAAYLSKGLVKKGHEIYVYNSHKHPYQKKTWHGAHIIHQFDPEYLIGPTGQFVYDFNSILDARKRKFDILLQLGYLSNSVWHRLLPKKDSVIATNMDGLEWKRSKWSKKTQLFLKWAEKLAAKSSHYLIADSVGIQTHLKNTYQKNSIYIAYGAHIFNEPSEQVLGDYGLKIHGYDMIIARLEPENNIEAILDGYLNTNINRQIIVVGSYTTKYGNYLTEKFNDKRIHFLGGIYDISVLNSLRYYSQLYFHGHSVGGTNPSLLEAMASNALICAHDNIFNRSILGNDAFYFRNQSDIAHTLLEVDKKKEENKLYNNHQKIRNIYNWDKIIDAYEKCFEEMLTQAAFQHAPIKISFNHE